MIEVQPPGPWMIWTGDHVGTMADDACTFMARFFRKVLEIGQDMGDRRLVGAVAELVRAKSLEIQVREMPDGTLECRHRLVDPFEARHALLDIRKMH